MLDVFLLVLVGALTLLYLYLRHNYGYWRRKGLPQPPTVLGFGHMLDIVLQRANPGHIYNRIYKAYPNNEAVGVCGFRVPKLLVRSPRLIQQVLVSDFSSFHDNEFYVSKRNDPLFYRDPFVLRGDEWKTFRTKLSKALTLAKTREIFPLMKGIIPRLDQYLDERNGEDVNAKEVATLFTMDNVSTCVFGITSNCFTDKEAAFRKMADLVMKDTLQSWWKNLIQAHMPIVRDLIGLKFVPASVEKFVKNLVQEILDYRLKNNFVRNDLFQHFMKKELGGKDEVNEIIHQAFTFFLEGFESSSMTASPVFYELALNSEIEQNLFEEVSTAFDDKQFDPDFDTLNALPYLDKVLQETMRKYTILYSNNRICTKPITLNIDGKPVAIEKGTPVIIPVFAIHRDPEFYPDPEKFDPERFSEESRASRLPNTHIPFGDGPRMCPGIKFSMAQVKLLIANIVLKYKIVKSPNTPDQLTFATGSFMLVPNEQMLVRFERRKSMKS